MIALCEQGILHDIIMNLSFDENVKKLFERAQVFMFSPNAHRSHVRYLYTLLFVPFVLRSSAAILRRTRADFAAVVLRRDFGSPVFLRRTRR